MSVSASAGSSASSSTYLSSSQDGYSSLGVNLLSSTHSSSSSSSSSAHPVPTETVRISITARSYIDQATNDVDAHLRQINAELDDKNAIAARLDKSLICRRRVANTAVAIGSIGSITGGAYVASDAGLSNPDSDLSIIGGCAVAIVGTVVSFCFGALIRSCSRTSNQYNSTLDRIATLKSSFAQFQAYRQHELFLQTAYCLYQTHLAVKQCKPDHTFINFLYNEKNLKMILQHLDEDMKKRIAEVFAKQLEQCRHPSSS